MRLTDFVTSALLAGFAFPSIAIATDGPASPPETSAREGEVRQSRTARPETSRTGEEKTVESTDEQGSSRSTDGPGHSATRNGEGEAFAGYRDGPRRGAEPMTAFRLGFDADGDGLLCEEEKARLKPALEKYHRSLMGPFDADRNGWLDDREWNGFLGRTFGEHVAWQQAIDRSRADAFRRTADVDGDGSLDEKETAAFQLALSGDRLLRLERFDRDADAALGEAELAFARESSVAVQADATGGRRLEIEEPRRTIGRTARAGDGRD
jgi:hypothetical protein